MIMQRVINKIFEKFKNRGVLVYINNIIIFNSDIYKYIGLVDNIVKKLRKKNTILWK